MFEHSFRFIHRIKFIFYLDELREKIQLKQKQFVQLRFNWDMFTFWHVKHSQSYVLSFFCLWSTEYGVGMNSNWVFSIIIVILRSFISITFNCSLFIYWLLFLLFFEFQNYVNKIVNCIRTAQLSPYTLFPKLNKIKVHKSSIGKKFVPKFNDNRTISLNCLLSFILFSIQLQRKPNMRVKWSIKMHLQYTLHKWENVIKRFPSLGC